MMITLQRTDSTQQSFFTLPIETGLKSSRSLMKAIRNDVDVIRMDMSSKTALNARELGKLLRLQRTILAQGRTLKLVNVSMRVLLFLELTQADTIFDISLNQKQNFDFAA